MSRIVRLTESKLVMIIKKIISEESIQLTNNSVNPILNKYLKSKPELIPLYQGIENKLGEKFTEEHFKNEISIVLEATVFELQEIVLQQQSCQDIGVQGFHGA